MKLGPISTESARQQRYDRLRRDRAAAKAIRSAYPTIATLGLQLHFEGSGTRVPADQVHTMHPPARAFFQFQCPYADCDGQFDLADDVRQALAASRKSTVGVLECSGSRIKDHTGRQPCGLHLHYTITPQYSRA
ncbi:MAG: hypothetical protein JSR66_13425 [Proteobacteria bacterium]|nr:hypothetical protein [Pseudomonadota bacterium]